jgi:hypothetical protein
VCAKRQHVGTIYLAAFFATDFCSDLILETKLICSRETEISEKWHSSLSSHKLSALFSEGKYKNLKLEVVTIYQQSSSTRDIIYN